MNNEEQISFLLSFSVFSLDFLLLSYGDAEAWNAHFNKEQQLCSSFAWLNMHLHVLVQNAFVYGLCLTRRSGAVQALSWDWA